MHHTSASPYIGFCMVKIKHISVI